MSRKRLYCLVGGGVAVAAIVLSLVFGVFQNSSGEKKGADLLASSVSQPTDFTQQGIKVHGHWSLEVRNPDGTVADRREFDNALTLVGAGRLTSILARNLSVGGYSIALGASEANLNPFLDASSNPIYGEIKEASYSGTYSSLFKTLTVTNPESGPNAFKLVLSGTATAARNGNIAGVTTRWELLVPTSPPSSSYNGITGGDFTSTTLTGANVLSVSTGQQIVVTVAISFS